VQGLASVVLGVAAAVVTLTGAPALAQMDSPIQVDAAQHAAEAWLALVDKGASDASWDQAATFFQRSVARDAWRQDLAKLRDPVGPLVSRKFSFRQYNERLPGAPAGQYVVITYRSTFRAKKDLSEIVTAAFDGTRGWRVAGYRIEGLRR